MTHQLVRNRHLQPGNRRRHSGNCRKHWGNPNLHPPHRRPQPGNGRPQPGFDDNPCKIKVLRIFSAKVARATRPPRSATSPNGTVAWKRASIIVDSGGGHSARRPADKASVPCPRNADPRAKLLTRLPYRNHFDSDAPFAPPGFRQPDPSEKRRDHCREISRKRFFPTRN